MHIYILGIGGTFMGSLAAIAKEMGFHVSGCDQNIYPPMSTQLEMLGIDYDQGYQLSSIVNKPIDLFIIGNALSRGNSMVEWILEMRKPFLSGPQFLHDHLLIKKRVLAVAGTHGKTTTSAMLAWILEDNGLAPGFLIGGVMHNFPISARLGNSEYFVIEADEYDTAFFDKRSKFLHYSPEQLIINNLEFDHADIFADLAAIQTQFHHLIRILPSNGTVIYPDQDPAVKAVLEKGCWSATIPFDLNRPTATGFGLQFEEGKEPIFSLTQQQKKCEVNWLLQGEHNLKNAFAAAIASMQVGLTIEQIASSLSRFKGVKRRMECIYHQGELEVFDDFAHHPTAIKTTLIGLRSTKKHRIIAVIELASNTMKQGIHKDLLKAATTEADMVFWFANDRLNWQWPEALGKLYTNIDNLLEALKPCLRQNDCIVLMSNSGFADLRSKLLLQLGGKDD